MTDLQVLLDRLENRGVLTGAYSGMTEKELKHFNRCQEMADENGRVHPVYRVRDGLLATTNPNILTMKQAWFQAAPGRTLLIVSPSKFEPVISLDELGLLEEARNLAESDCRLGEYILRRLGRPSPTKEETQYAKVVFFQGLMGKANPDLVDPSFSSAIPVPSVTWDQIRSTIFGGLPAGALGRDSVRERSRKVRVRTTDVLLKAARDYESQAQFSSTLTGLFHDSLIIEADASQKQAIIEWAGPVFASFSGYRFRVYVNSDIHAPAQARQRSRMEMLLDSSN